MRAGATGPGLQRAGLPALALAQGSERVADRRAAFRSQQVFDAAACPLLALPRLRCEPVRSQAIGGNHLTVGFEGQVSERRQLKLGGAVRQVFGELPEVLLSLFVLQVQFHLVHLQFVQQLECVAGALDRKSVV